MPNNWISPKQLVDKITKMVDEDEDTRDLSESERNMIKMELCAYVGVRPYRTEGTPLQKESTDVV